MDVSGRQTNVSVLLFSLQVIRLFLEKIKINSEVPIIPFLGNTVSGDRLISPVKLQLKIERRPRSVLFEIAQPHEYHQNHQYQSIHAGNLRSRHTIATNTASLMTMG